MSPTKPNEHKSRMSHRPRVVLLPGLDGTGRLFKRFVARCPEHLAAQVVSYPVDELLDYGQLADLIYPQLPSGAPYFIVAESFSGPIAVDLASRPIGDLRGIVLAASFATSSAWKHWRFLPWVLAFRFRGARLAIGQLLTSSDAELTQDFREVLKVVSPKIMAGRVRLALSVDAREALAKVRCPILCLQARRDVVVSTRCLRDIEAVRDDVVVKHLDTPHPVLQVAPEESWRFIEEFALGPCADSRQTRG